MAPQAQWRCVGPDARATYPAEARDGATERERATGRKGMAVHRGAGARRAARRRVSIDAKEKRVFQKRGTEDETKRFV